MDEPTASLDIETSDFIRKYLVKFQKTNNSAILITSHNLEEIQYMCDYLIILENGMIKSFGTIKNLLMSQKKLKIINFYSMINRILALMIRYYNIALGSVPRLISIFYWPSVQILFWGFFTNYFYQINDFNIWSTLNIILSAVVLWDVLFRSQLGLSMSFFEELWSRNLPNLFITPLKDVEIIIGLLLISFLRTILGLTPAIFFANYFFNFHLFDLGLYLIFFFFNLTIIGWSIGLIVSALVLRYGQSFEELAWAIIFIILPFSCVYYPLDSLPEIMQTFSKFFPTTMIFEEMRSLILKSTFDVINLIKIIFINMSLLTASSIFFLYILSIVRKKGAIFSQGE